MKNKNTIIMNKRLILKKNKEKQTQAQHVKLLNQPKLM